MKFPSFFSFSSFYPHCSFVTACFQQLEWVVWLKMRPWYQPARQKSPPFLKNTTYISPAILLPDFSLIPNDCLDMGMRKWIQVHFYLQDFTVIVPYYCMWKLDSKLFFFDGIRIPIAYLWHKEVFMASVMIFCLYFINKKPRNNILNACMKRFITWLLPLFEQFQNLSLDFIWNHWEVWEMQK